VSIEKRYKSDAVRYYARRLTALVDECAFKDKPPAKDWDDRIGRAKLSFVQWYEQSERKIMDIGEKVDNKVKEKDWKNKLAAVFKRNTNKGAAKLAGSGAVGDALAVSTVLENPIVGDEVTQG
jgi:hypothetical protein